MIYHFVTILIIFGIEYCGILERHQFLISSIFNLLELNIKSASINSPHSLFLVTFNDTDLIEPCSSKISLRESILIF